MVELFNDVAGFLRKHIVPILTFYAGMVTMAIVTRKKD